MGPAESYRLSISILFSKTPNTKKASSAPSNYNLYHLVKMLAFAFLGDPETMHPQISYGSLLLIVQVKLFS